MATAIDLALIRRHHKNMLLVTPLDVYEKVALGFTRVIIWAANGQSLAGIEKVFYKTNPKMDIVGVSLAPIIPMIEARQAPLEIIRALGLPYGGSAFGNAQALILGCTHFPYFYDALKDMVDIPVIDPGARNGDVCS